jgi:Zn-dependent protease/CBS domain-containing protein
MNGGIPVVSLFGIEFRVSFTLAAMAGFVALIAADQTASLAPDTAAAFQWLIGAGVATSFVISVLVHELAHALVGRRRGVTTTSATLGLVGGLAPLSIEATQPGDELAIAIAGPLASLVIASVVLPAGLALGLAVPSVGPLAGALFVIGALNLMLGLASLLPGLPLDGGRVVRALAWARTGDRDRAAVATARIGRYLGWAVVGIGAVVMLVEDPILGLMLGALGWLLGGASRGIEQRAELEHAVRGVTVAEALLLDVPQIGPSLTLDTFAGQLGVEGTPSAVPVVEHDQVLGVVGVTALRRLPRRKLAASRAADVMATPPAAPLLATTDGIWACLEVMQRRGLDGLAVVEEGRLVGMVTRESASAVLRSRLPAIPAAWGRRR